MARRHAGALNPILRAVAGARKVWPDPPKWADPALLRDLMGADQPARRCWLVQDVPSGCLLLQDEPASLRQIPMGEPLALDAGGVRVSAAGAGAARWLSAAALPARLAPLGEPGVLHLETSREALVVAAVRRPNGAFGWGCDQNGIAIRTAPLGRWEMHWSGSALRATPAAEGDQTASWTLQADAVAHPDSRGAVLFGIDSRLGIFADLAITTRYGSATQRLRWIPPGSFLMGSPATEAGRYDVEGPQHDVTIAQGFWLFDTPCTQALWQAVMGDNPSYFKRPDRPVEQVSWDDVQDFLAHSTGSCRGSNLTLPTEAQWEYACRAGTDTRDLYRGPRDRGRQQCPRARSHRLVWRQQRRRLRSRPGHGQLRLAGEAVSAHPGRHPAGWHERPECVGPVRHAGQRLGVVRRRDALLHRQAGNRPARAPPRPARSASFAAAPGAATRASCALRTGTRSSWASATTASASAVPEFRSVVSRARSRTPRKKMRTGVGASRRRRRRDRFAHHRPVGKARKWMVERPRDHAWQSGPGLSRSTPMPLPERFPNPFPPPFAGAWGDDVYGLWADLQVPATAEADLSPSVCAGSSRVRS